MHLATPIRALFTDIDDTLTTDGAVTPDAIAALARLASTQVPAVAITGRPVGWSVSLLNSLPTGLLRAVVAENGAVMLLPQADGVEKRYAQPEAQRTANFSRLQQVLAELEALVPGALRARDSAGRETDIAIDHSEFAQLSPQAIERVAAHMRRAGLVATISSIHINGWIGSHNKLTGARWAAAELLGDASAQGNADWDTRRYVFVGDSTNDTPMFEAFDQSIGVANVRRFWAALAHKPKWVTRGERGAGFAELVDAVMAAQGEAASSDHPLPQPGNEHL
jgi:HAD superfamily hydrolase (TIGR01484 family)